MPLPLLQAHEDSEKLREIVLPMEQEIEELKAKLLNREKSAVTPAECVLRSDEIFRSRFSR